MNHIYNLVWNRSLGVLQVVSELTRVRRASGGIQATAGAGRRRRLLTAAACVALPLCAAPALATPGNPQVIMGKATVASASGNTTITQSSNRAIINWSNFSVAAGHVMQFAQPGRDSAVLNRVTGGDPSAIYGKIQANGEVFLLNPNGVLVGPSGVIEAGSFVASTLDVGNAAFMAGGKLDFSGHSTAGVQNFGFVRASNGDVVLLGHRVENAGALEAPKGTVALAAANDVQLTDSGDDLVVVNTGVPGGGTGVSNAGTIRAAQARLTAAGGNVYALAVSDSGLIDATGISTKDGRVVLTSDAGNVQVSGSIEAQDANGSGGTILVGGGEHGADASVPDAANLTVTAGATLDANATGAAGQGGKVVLWSNGRTDFGGAITARGGARGGNGGSAEVSGKAALDYLGKADLSAPHGSTGTLLLDPNDIDIDTSSTAADGTSGGVTTLTAATLNAQLQTAAVTIQTNASISGGNGDIAFVDSSGQNTPFATSLANSLTISAARDVNIDVPIQISASSVGGAATGATPGTAGPNLNIGSLNIDAARNITAVQPLSLQVVSTGGQGGSGVGAAGGSGGAGGAIVAGGMSLQALGAISLQSNISMRGTSTGGAGGGSTGGVAGGSGGAGGAITLGSLALSARSTLTVGSSSTLAVALASTGGVGGAGAAGGNGGAGGTIIDEGMSLSAGDTTTGLTFNGNVSLSATSTGAQGGTGVSIASPVNGTNAGGDGGATSIGNVSLSAPDLGLDGGVAVNANTAYGIGGVTGGGNGGNGGNITDGAISLTATAGNISGELFGLNMRFGTSSQLGGIGSGASGVNGAFTPGAAMFEAAQGIDLGNSANPASSQIGMSSLGDISLVAGQNVQLQIATIGSATGVTLVADNAHPAAPGFGLSTISLDSASSITAPVERVFAVSPSYVSFGTWTAPAVVGTGAADYYGQPGTSGSGVYYKVPANGQPLDIAANDATATFGQALPAFTANYNGLVNGDTSSAVTGLQFSTTAHVGSNVGRYSITPYGATAPSYYTVTYTPGTLTVDAASLTVAADNAATTYGSALPTLTDTVSGLVNGDAQASVVSLAPTTTAVVGSNVGTYTINPGATLLDSNYALTQAPGTLTVNAAPLTVTAGNASTTYGSALPTLADTVSGLVNGDAQASVVSLAPTTTATVGSNVGTYTINPGATLLDSNYALTQVPGTLTIESGGNPLDITANDVTATYGRTLPAFTASYGGFINGDTATVVTGLQFSTSAHVGSNVGSYTITPFGATVPAYYTPVYQSGTLTIDPATLTVAADDVSATYGSPVPTLTDTVSGLVNGDAQASVVSLAPTTTAVVGSNVGTYAIDAGARLLDSNYTLDSVAGTLTINAAPLTITVLGEGVVRGDIPRGVASGPSADAPLPVISQKLPSGETEVLVSYTTQYDETASVLLGITGLWNAPVAAGGTGSPIDLSALGGVLGGAPNFKIDWGLSRTGSMGKGLLMPAALAVNTGSLQAVSENYTISQFGSVNYPNLSGQTAHGLIVFNPTITVGVPTTYLWPGDPVQSTGFIFNGLRGTSAVWNGKDAGDLFGNVLGVRSDYNPSNPVSQAYALTPVGPPVLSDGDEYGAYDVTYEPGTLLVLGSDGSLSQALQSQYSPPVTLCRGTRCSTVTITSNAGPAISATEVDGLTVPYLQTMRVASPTVFGIPMAFSSELLSAVGDLLRSEGRRGDSADAYDWLSANAGSGAMAGALVPFIIQEVTTLENEGGGVTPGQRAFVKYVESYLAVQKHDAAVEAWQQWSACKNTSACEGPASPGLMSLFGYWSDQSTPTPQIMALSETGVDTSNLTSAQQTALTAALETLGGVGAGSAAGAAASSSAVLTTIQPFLQRAGSAAISEAADLAGGPAAIVGAAVSVLVNGIMSFVNSSADVNTLQQNAQASSFGTVADTFNSGNQGGELQDVTMLSMMMTGGGNYDFNASLPPQTTVTQTTTTPTVTVLTPTINPSEVVTVQPSIVVMPVSAPASASAPTPAPTPASTPAATPVVPSQWNRIGHKQTGASLTSPPPSQ